MAPLSLVNILSFAALSALSFASPLHVPGSAHEVTRRDINSLPHGEIQVIPEDVGSGGTGKIFKKFQPLLKILDGCTTWPGVDADGNVSKGLKDSGRMNGLCKYSDGQVYVRGKEAHGRFAIMYAWYFPKDQIDHHFPGHRHDWEDVVVWLTGNKKDAEVVGVSYSNHGKYHRYTVEKGKNEFVGNRVKVAYSTFGVNTHSLDSGKGHGEGESQPMIGWEQMSDATKEALNDYNFGKAVVPFKDADDRFNSQIEKSWDSIYE